MIIAIVNFRGAPDEPRERVLARFTEAAPRFRAIPGLVRKNFIHDAASGTGGGVYLWETRAAAEAYYDAAWRERMTKLLGNTPTVQYFDSPVQVDNSVERITVD